MEGYPEEAFVIAKLMARGWNCCQPFAPERYDFIACKDDKYLKIQVKLIGKNTSGTHEINYTSSNKKYKKGEIDIFVGVHMKKDHCYVLPFSVIEGKRCNVVYYGKKDGPMEKYLDAWEVLNA